MSLVDEAQAVSKMEISKIRMPVNPACLITEANLCAGHLRCNQPRKTAVTDCTGSRSDRRPIQKCPELLPPSPFGAYDGLAKCASTAVIFGSVFRSVTTPSWDSEAQAQSNHAIIKASIPQHAACLFTTRNLLIDDLDATSGFPALILKERSHEKILRGKRSSPLVPYGRQLGRA